MSHDAYIDFACTSHQFNTYELSALGMKVIRAEKKPTNLNWYESKAWDNNKFVVNHNLSLGVLSLITHNVRDIPR